MCHGDSGGSSQGSFLVGVTTLNIQTIFASWGSLDAQHSMTDHPQSPYLYNIFQKRGSYTRKLMKIVPNWYKQSHPSSWRQDRVTQTCTPKTKCSCQGKGEGDSNRLQSFCLQSQKGATVDRPGLFLHKQLRGKCCASLILYKLQTGLIKCITVYKCTITAALSNQPLRCCQLPPTQALLQ